MYYELNEDTHVSWGGSNTVFFRLAVQASKAQSAGAPFGKAETVIIREAGDPAPPWFAAMEYYLLIWNRTYKVFVTNHGLFGAKVRGAVTNPVLTTSKMYDQAYWVDTRSSRVYGQLELASDAFLRVNSANFRLPWAGVSAIDYLPGRKWGMGNVPHSGRLFIRLRSGQQRELILLGQQDGEALKHRLDVFVQG